MPKNIRFVGLANGQQIWPVEQLRDAHAQIPDPG
jgi:hypothetical protein